MALLRGLSVFIGELRPVSISADPTGIAIQEQADWTGAEPVPISIELQVTAARRVLYHRNRPKL